MSLSMRAFQRHGLQTGLLLIALVALPGSVVGANLSRADQAKLFSLQKKIDELNRASKYEAAIPIAQQRLAMVEKLKGSDHSDTAASYDILGELYRHAGDFSKAEPILQRALTIAEKVLGPDHPETANILNNGASLCTEVGDYAKAEALY